MGDKLRAGRGWRVAGAKPGEETMLKKVLIGIAALVIVLIVAVGGGVYYLYSNLDAIVKAAIESYGGDATQTKVSVQTVKLSLTSGEGSISGLVVGNPSGFATPQSLSLGSVSMKVDTASVTKLASDPKAPVVIKEVVIASPAITYERGTSGGNLEKIQENVSRYAGLDKSKPAAKPAAGGKDEQKLIIENLYVRDGQIAISHSALQGKTLSSGLPTIHLKDIGKDKGGATPAEIADKVLGSITQQAAKVASIDLDKSLGQLKGVVDQQLKGAVPQQVPGNVGDRLQGIMGGQKKP
jgi:hypothetical protein